jgi:hypothetical protein
MQDRPPDFPAAYLKEMDHAKTSLAVHLHPLRRSVDLNQGRLAVVGGLRAGVFAHPGLVRRQTASDSRNNQKKSHRVIGPWYGMSLQPVT